MHLLILNFFCLYNIYQKNYFFIYIYNYFSKFLYIYFKKYFFKFTYIEINGGPQPNLIKKIKFKSNLIVVELEPEPCDIEYS